ncbi:MAG: fibronectin type III domain-containing protein [Bacteroidales bacterium]|jgi:hypothetical protein
MKRNSKLYKISTLCLIIIIPFLFCKCTKFDIPTVNYLTLDKAEPWTLTVSAVLIDNGGEVPYDVGFCCSINYEPTIDSCLVRCKVASHALGDFTGVLAGLTPNTNYIVKAYAINSAGVGYSNPIFVSTTR